ncbi:MAG: hypothetical protein OWU32_13530 [Firmicutes bacterium]|nr:hypothetical protein [Bacillota bacterium]
MTIALFAVILFIAVLVDVRPLVQEGSAKVWSLYGGITGLSIALLILSVAMDHDSDIFAPLENILQPLSKWVFQAS